MNVSWRIQKSLWNHYWIWFVDFKIPTRKSNKKIFLTNISTSFPICQKQHFPGSWLSCQKFKSNQQIFCECRCCIDTIEDKPLYCCWDIYINSRLSNIHTYTCTFTHSNINVNINTKTLTWDGFMTMENFVVFIHTYIHI